MDEQLPPVGILNFSQSDLVCYFQAIFDVLTVREGLKKTCFRLEFGKRSDFVFFFN